MNQFTKTLGYVSMALALGACAPADSAPGPVAAPVSGQTAQPAKQAVSIAAITRATKGFTTGQAMAAKTAYVFFDAQCSHCAALWEAAKPLEAKARFVWIPVGLLNKASTSQGAAILSAKDPVAAMNEHEALFSARKGGLTASASVSPHMAAAIRANSETLVSFDANSVPFIVTLDSAGKVVTKLGAPTTAQLAELLGVAYVAPTGPGPRIL